MKGILKPVVIVAGIFAALMIVSVIAVCPGGWGCDYRPPQAVLNLETELIYTAMHAMMADKKITTVTPNDDTNNSLGVNTWRAMPEGPDASSLYAYLKKATTKFYYCWDIKGNVYAQNKKDDVSAEPKDAEEQRPCKRAP